MTSAPKEIWLEPACEREDCRAYWGQCRIWHDEDVWGQRGCDECGRHAVKYVLAEPDEFDQDGLPTADDVRGILKQS